MTEPLQTVAGMPRLPIVTILQRAEPVDAPAIITGAALQLMQRMARDTAWDRCHRCRLRNREPFAVDETAIIRGRTVTLRLFIARSGATYRRHWRVDGRAWRADQVAQAFGA